MLAARATNVCSHKSGRRGSGGAVDDLARERERFVRERTAVGGEDELGEPLGGILATCLEPVDGDAELRSELPQGFHGRAAEAGFDPADVRVRDPGRGQLTL